MSTNKANRESLTSKIEKLEKMKIEDLTLEEIGKIRYEIHHIRTVVHDVTEYSDTEIKIGKIAERATLLLKSVDAREEAIYSRKTSHDSETPAIDYYRSTGNGPIFAQVKEKIDSGKQSHMERLFTELLMTEKKSQTGGGMQIKRRANHQS